jgi:hypothetical protein
VDGDVVRVFFLIDHVAADDLAQMLDRDAKFLGCFYFRILRSSRASHEHCG